MNNICNRVALILHQITIISIELLTTRKSILALYSLQAITSLRHMYRTTYVLWKQQATVSHCKYILKYCRAAWVLSMNLINFCGLSILNSSVIHNYIQHRQQSSKLFCQIKRHFYQFAKFILYIWNFLWHVYSTVKHGIRIFVVEISQMKVIQKFSHFSCLATWLCTKNLCY